MSKSLLTHSDLGHEFNKFVVHARDANRCMAPVLDKDCGPCYDMWGKQVHRQTVDTLEADYVRFASNGGRHQFVCDHISLCPGHHRGSGPTAGFIWATANRALLRAHLEDLYKEEHEQAIPTSP